MQKMTMQQLADTLGVSRITVWKVLNQKPGVSDELRKDLLRKLKQLGYEHPAVINVQSPAEKVRTFAVVVARPESSVFWINIIHHLAKELARNNINLMYIYVPAIYREGYTLPAILHDGSLDGMLVLNMYDTRILEQLSALSLPRVFLDSAPGMDCAALGGDLVLIQGREPVEAITFALLKSGRRKLGFIGDINYARTNMDRYQGFLDAHTALSLAPDPQLSLLTPLKLDAHFEQISAFLESLDRLPDAFVCVSDFIADFVERYFIESGRKRPASFLITGFDNSTEYPVVAGKITTADVQTEQLGMLLARKLMFRADYMDAPLEVSYIRVEPLFRAPLNA